jgi:AbrB family looped-hinge helix DNA binding protein
MLAWLVMSKVTGKFQVTLPKRLVTTYGIKVGDEVEFSAAGDRIALLPARRKPVDRAHRLREFDRATERQRSRERTRPLEAASKRDWKREELYSRGRSG